MQRPLCFILMPFGSKPDPTGRPPIDFDRVYGNAIKPAVEDAGMIPIRADEEKTGGIIHKPMFERLLLCEYAVADLTTANANVFYELGVRHTARPRSTQAIFAKHQPIPFDVNYLRGLPYELGENNQFGESEAAALRTALGARLLALRQSSVAQAAVDSPVFQLVGEWKPGVIAHSKTDVFREQVEANEALRQRMAQARSMQRSDGVAELGRIQQEITELDIAEIGIVIDLMLSYRALEGWTEMIALIESMPEEVRRQVLVREQLGFALNRRAGDRRRSEPEREADRSRALRVLEEVEEQQGPSSETCGLIGRIYKDRWSETREADPARARGHLKQAIDAYVRGFEADLRDPYPGVNAVTLLDVKGDASSKAKRDQLAPVVLFAVRQRLRSRKPDYWDYATMLELAVLASDEESAREHLDSALAAVREVWEPATTARNLGLLSEVRAARGEETAWIEEIIGELKRGAA